jgi:hypothetical protein
MPVSDPYRDFDYGREIEIIERALAEHGGANRRELRRRVGGRYWGPGVFNAALREAVIEGRAKRVRGGEYAPAEEQPRERPPVPGR